MVIDLHLYEKFPYPLSTQLEHFEREMDKALVLGLSNITVIHGIGGGVLKSEIHKLAKKHPHVESFINEYHPLYGFGSTKITFK